MTKEETIKQELIGKFGFAEGEIKISRQRRVSLRVAAEKFREVFAFCARELGFQHLCAITGLDEGDFLSFIYHLSGAGGIILNLKASVPKANPVLETVTNYFAGAEIYERELVDLLGAKIIGLPPGNRYPLADDWPEGEYPLRKDWRK